MQIITINLPEKYLDAIQILNDLGIYSNRSETIRVALERFLKQEHHFQKDLNLDEFELQMAQTQFAEEGYFQ